MRVARPLRVLVFATAAGLLGACTTTSIPLYCDPFACSTEVTLDVTCGGAACGKTGTLLAIVAQTTKRSGTCVPPELGFASSAAGITLSSTTATGISVSDVQYASIDPPEHRCASARLLTSAGTLGPASGGVVIALPAPDPVPIVIDTLQ